MNLLEHVDFDNANTHNTKAMKEEVNKMNELLAYLLIQLVRFTSRETIVFTTIWDLLTNLIPELPHHVIERRSNLTVGLP